MVQLHEEIPEPFPGLRTDEAVCGVENESRHPADALKKSRIPQRPDPGGMLFFRQRLFQTCRIDSGGGRNLQDRLQSADVPFFDKMRTKEMIVEPVKCILSLCEFRCFQGQGGIVKPFRAAEGQIGNAGLSGQFAVEFIKNRSREHIRQKPSFGGRFRVDFKGDPFDFEGNFLSDAVDNGLADITERSDVVIKDTDMYGHAGSFRSDDGI